MRELLLDTYNMNTRTYKGRHTGCLVICPRCHKEGFLTRRWVRTYGPYFPEVSVYTFAVKSYLKSKDLNQHQPLVFVQFVQRMMENVRVFEMTNHYFDKETAEDVYIYQCTFDPSGKNLMVKPHIIKIKKGETKNITKMIFQVVKKHKKEIRYYVGHYDSKKYKEKLAQFKAGKLKFRPNGRTWCLMDKNVMWSDYGSSEVLYEDRSWVLLD